VVEAQKQTQEYYEFEHYRQTQHVKKVL